MEKAINIILVEDNPADAELIQATLEAHGLEFEMTRVDTEAAFKAALQARPDLVISDHSLPAYNGKAALHEIQRAWPDVPFLFYSGTIGEEAAIDALKLGATDYVLKDNPRRLIPAISRALDDAAQRQRQREADEHIRAQAQLLDLATDAIMVRDMNDRVLFWNKGAEAIFGLPSAEALGRDIKQLIVRHPAPYLQAREHTLARGHWQGELEHLNRQGGAVTVMSRWSLVRDPEGRPSQILAIDTDITEKKQLELKFLRAQRLESVGTLASGIAHDLNNILAPILMGCDIIKELQPSREAAEMVEMMRSSGQRGAGIVKQLLTFVRGSDGKIIPIDPAALLEEVCRVARQTFPKNITTECRLEPCLPPVKGDPTQLNQVLMNLCINARDAMPGGGRLILSAEPLPDAQLLIQVADTGTGIPQEIMEKIFDPFFTTKEPGKGTGLGLSTVVGIIKGHGGTLKVESQPGTGTTFQILLPVEKASEDISRLKSASGTQRGQGELILVVDDEPDIRKFLSRALTQAGYDVITAHDGASGIVQFTENKDRVRLVLTDLMMPGIDGGTLASSVRRIKPAVKILASSGLPGHSDPGAADRTIKKPFSVEELLTTVAALIQQTA